MHGHNMDNDQGGIADTLTYSDRPHTRPALNRWCQLEQNDDWPVCHGIDSRRNIADTWHISTQQYRLSYDSVDIGLLNQEKYHKFLASLDSQFKIKDQYYFISFNMN